MNITPNQIDHLMTRVYRYVSTLGHQRAIVEVAGDRFSSSGKLVPNIELQSLLRKRYEREIREFTDAGGY